MSNQCPLCDKRVSDWEMASNKCVFINQRIVHTACLIDKLPTEVIDKCKPS